MYNSKKLLEGRLTFDEKVFFFKKITAFDSSVYLFTISEHSR